jgi:SAM-dependent methyltransferase
MTTPSHLGGSNVNGPDVTTWLPDIWERLITTYGVKSVLDVGCGAGFATRWFQERVGKALGVEGDPAALAHRRCDAVVGHDFTTGPFTPIDIYDLGWSAEFVEHVEAKYMCNWMAALQRCRHVCITFATPGQGGHHHVNEQVESYWVERFKAAGLDHVPEETARLRATAGNELYGRRTLTFFTSRIVGLPDTSWWLNRLRELL